jgi:hypothetical protein
MSPSERYFRVFDLHKYREIQPILDSIAYRKVDCKQVIPLADEALKILELNDPEKYNDPESRETFIEDLQELLIVLRKGELLSWIYEKSYSYSELHRLTFILCCPKYQEIEYFDKKSETLIGYVELYQSKGLCQLEFLNFLDKSDSFEDILVGREDRDLRILSRQQLPILNKAVDNDINALSELKHPLDEKLSNKRKDFLEFYHDFKKMIYLTSENHNYTLLIEIPFI